MSAASDSNSSIHPPVDGVGNPSVSPSNPASSSPSTHASVSSLLARIRAKQLQHRTRGQWANAEAWTRHNLHDSFNAFVQESFAHFGRSAPPLSSYASVETFREKLASEDAKRTLNVRHVSEVPRLDGTSFTKSSFQQLVEQNDLPCIFSHLSDGWNMKSWTMESIASPSFKYAQVKFKVDEHAAAANDSNTHEQHESEEEKEQESSEEPDPATEAASSSEIDSLQSDSFKLSLHDFMQYLSHNRDDVPLYIFDAVFDCDPLGKEIMDDFTPPPLFQPDLFKYLGPVRRPPFQWILIGPTRSGSALHTDPLQTSAWNTCIDGVKRWVLFPPHVQREKVKGQHLVSSDFNRTKSSTLKQPESSSSSSRDQSAPALTADDVDDAMEAAHYFTHGLPLLRAQAATPSLDDNITANLSYSTGNSAAPIPLEFLQYPGETVFVPAGWLHAVINLTPTLAMTQNFISPQHFADAYVETYIKRPHMCARWKEQLKRYQPEMFELTQQLESMPPLSLAAPLPFSQANRRPSSSFNTAAEDGDSWYYNNSSDEGEDEEQDEKADSSYA